MRIELRPLREQLEEFLDTKDLNLPGQCYEPGDAPRKEAQASTTERASRLKFVIATLPDPVHTHLPAFVADLSIGKEMGYAFNDRHPSSGQLGVVQTLRPAGNAIPCVALGFIGMRVSVKRRPKER